MSRPLVRIRHSSDERNEADVTAEGGRNGSEMVDLLMSGFQEFSNWAVGLGIVTVALFPLAIPIVVLTAVALLPLLVPVLALGLVAAPVLLARRLLRWRKRSDPHEGGRSLRVGTVNAERVG
jgi:hypothetical protein